MAARSLVVARDGYVLPGVGALPGRHRQCRTRSALRRVIWKALRPGKWLVHCHIPHHTTNNNVEQDGGGGLMMVLEVEA